MIVLLLVILRIRVTAQSGIDSKKPQFSTAVIISCGKFIAVAPPIPEAFIIVDIVPCMMSNIDVSSSSPCVMRTLHIANLINILNACSGFLSSATEPQVFITPTKKNITNRANAIA